MGVISGIAAVMLVGFFLRRSGAIGEEAAAAVSRLCADVLVPATILQSMLMELTAEILRQSAWLIFASVLLLTVSWFSGRLLVRLYRSPPEDSIIHRYCVLFSNFGLIGLPIAEGFFGRQGVFYFTMAILAPRVLFNSYGVLMMRGAPGGRLSWRSFVNMPLAAVLLAVVLDVLHLGLWGPVGEFVGLLARANAPMGLLAVGLNLGGTKVSDGIRDRRVWTTVGIRLLLLPLLTLAAVLPMPVPALLKQVTVLNAALPCPAMASVLARRYGRNAALGSELVLLSTMLSIVTIPLVLRLCEVLLT